MDAASAATTEGGIRRIRRTPGDLLTDAHRAALLCRWLVPAGRALPAFRSPPGAGTR